MTKLPFYANIILTLVGTAIAVGNAIVCFAFYSNKKIRTMTNHFVISLAFSDFLIGSVLAPMSAWNSSSLALGPLIAFTLIGSLSNICGCTYDRYVAIHYPLRYQAILTKAKLYKVLFVIWLVPVIIALVPQLWQAWGDKIGLSSSAILKTNRIFVGCMAFGVLATCIVLTGIYVGIFRVARRHFAAISYLSNFTRSPRGQRETNGTRGNVRRLRRFSLKSLVKDVKSTKLFAIIATTFVFCWLPLIIINIADSLGYQDKIPMNFVRIALFTIFGNSLVNPIIYAFFQPSFRQTTAAWFRCKRWREKPDDLVSLNFESREDKRLERNKTKKVKIRKKAKKTTYELQSRQEVSTGKEDSLITETRFDNNERLLVNGGAIPNGVILPEVRL